jgi:hypothetical protein
MYWMIFIVSIEILLSFFTTQFCKFWSLISSQLYIIPCWNNFHDFAKSSGSFGASWALDIVIFQERINGNYGRRTRTVSRVKCDFLGKNKIRWMFKEPYFTFLICFDHYFSPNLIISAKSAYVLWTHIKKKKINEYFCLESPSCFPPVYVKCFSSLSVICKLQITIEFYLALLANLQIIRYSSVHYLTFQILIHAWPTLDLA